MGKSAAHGMLKFICIAMTLALSALTLIAGRSENTPPTDSVILPLLGLLLPGFLIACLLASAGWLCARKWWAVVPLIAMAGCWSYLTSTLQFGRPSAPSGLNHRLKIATYNVANFGQELTGYSCKQIARLMEENEVDIIFFQEFGSNQSFNMDSICKVFMHWSFSYIPRRDGLSHLLPLAIFSRYPLIECKNITFTETANNCAMCDVITTCHDTLRLINCHLQTTHITQKRHSWQRELRSGETRRDLLTMQDASQTLQHNFIKRQMQTYKLDSLIKCSPHRILLGGDFNSIPSSHTYRTLTTHLHDGFRSAGHGYMYTYKYAKHLLRIDYLLHSPKLCATDYYSPSWDLCSDHNPVLMEIAY